MLVTWTMEVAVEASIAEDKWMDSGYVCGLELTGFADHLYVGMKK